MALQPDSIHWVVRRAYPFEVLAEYLTLALEDHAIGRRHGRPRCLTFTRSQSARTHDPPTVSSTFTDWQRNAQQKHKGSTYTESTSTSETARISVVAIVWKDAP